MSNDKQQKTREPRTKIVAVRIQSNSMDDVPNDERFDLLEQVLSICQDAAVVLLPAGFFRLPEVSEQDINWLAHVTAHFLEQIQSDAVYCMGVDCDGKNDQLAFAVNRHGILAMGRKFYPTESEKGKIRAAERFDSEEMGYPRFFTVNGKRFYLAVCYDCFGISHSKDTAPKVDAVLALVHSFWPKGSGQPSGDTDFARKGFAGASQRWKCPVFGTAVFFNREVPNRWPSGVLWSETNKSVRDFKYEDNKMMVYDRQAVSSRHEIAICDSYYL